MTITVSSADFLRAYGRVSEAAQREPVSITSHGRERLVLLSAQEYRRLKQNDREALYPWELGELDLAALEATKTSEESLAFSDEMNSR